MPSYWKLLKSFLAQSGRSYEQAIVAPIDAPSLQVIGVPDSETIDDAKPNADGASPGMASDGPLPEAHAQVRPLGPKMGNALAGMPVTAESLTAAMNSPIGDELCHYFRHYPTGSIMGDKSRAMLFVLVRMLRPRAAAEIGTYFAGGAEVMARALWENGEGVLHTTDPFGADRCPAILATWPSELRALVQFHPLNSMEFLIKLHHQGLALDFVLIDGDHDYEAVLFDLQMSARLLRPNGIVLLNDAVQSGPFQAARTFLAANLAWREIGTAISSYDEDSPFVGQWTSQHDTNFLVLQAPDHWSVGALPRSWGQTAAGAPVIDEIVIDAVPQRARGTLHYRAILRVFGEGAPQEAKLVGSLPIELQGTASTLVHRLKTPLSFDVLANPDTTKFTSEIELCWRADQGSPPLALASPPRPGNASF